MEGGGEGRKEDQRVGRLAEPRRKRKGESAREERKKSKRQKNKESVDLEGQKRGKGKENRQWIRGKRKYTYSVKSSYLRLYHSIISHIPFHYYT